MHTHNSLQWRYATKQFDVSKELPADDLVYILEAGRLTATSFGLQPLKIVVVTDKAKKQALMEKAYGQEHVGTNSALLVLAARTDIDEIFIAEYTARIEAARNLPTGTADGYKDTMVGSLTKKSDADRLIWAQKQCYIVLGTMMIAAAERQVDGCPMEGFDPAGFNEILGLDTHHLHATVIFPIGYRAATDQTQHYAKVRIASEDFVVTI